MRLLLFLPLLSGCSALMVGEMGYNAHMDGTLQGAEVAMHSAFGVGAGATDDVPAVGLGFAGRLRSYGAPYTVIQPGLEAYILKDAGPLSFYLRGISYVGMSILPEHVGVVFSPTLQPGMLICPNSRIGWCISLSAPVGYDVAAQGDRPGLNVGASLGIGWGNVVSNDPDLHF